MKAFTRTRYGGPEILRLQEVDKPEVKEDHLLIKVMANSANPADWHILRGEPFFARFTVGLFRPKQQVPGVDFAGIVVETGKNVRQFKTGDRVYGESLHGGSFAEFTSVSANLCARMPDGVGFAEMAAVPMAGLTAWQAIVTHGQVKEGESVLINGSSGGVGHFSVQIARACGAKVTAVCSKRNTDFVLSLGATRVIAYDETDIHSHEGKYDLIIDTNGNLTYADYQRMGKRGVSVGFTNIKHMIGLQFKKATGKFPLAQFTAVAKTGDLEKLANLIQTGKLKAHIEKTYPYTEIPAAISYIEAMHTRGKVVMVWDGSETK